MPSLNIHEAEIYTDGSCHTQRRIGAWSAILFTNGGKQTLSGIEYNTTHNRMEVTAVIKAIEYIRDNYPTITHLNIVSDSQYVTNLPAREKKLTRQHFITSKGNELHNADLIKKLVDLYAIFTIGFVKIKAHQKNNGDINYNREADMLCRQLVRSLVEKNT